MISPQLVILAGPNGAGRTTFARNNLGTLIDQQAFLNADEIARDANPSNVGAVAMEAGRAAIARRAEFLLRRQDFCIETTLATRTRQPVEIVRKELAGTSVHDEASLKLLNEAVAVAGGQPLAGT